MPFDVAQGKRRAVYGCLCDWGEGVAHGPMHRNYPYCFQNRADRKDTKVGVYTGENP